MNGKHLLAALVATSLALLVILIAGCDRPGVPKTTPKPPAQAMSTAVAPAIPPHVVTFAEPVDEYAVLDKFNLRLGSSDVLRWCSFDGSDSKLTVTSFDKDHACEAIFTNDCGPWFEQAAKARAAGYKVDFTCVPQTMVFRVYPKPGATCAMPKALLDKHAPFMAVNPKICVPDKPKAR